MNLIDNLFSTTTNQETVIGIDSAATSTSFLGRVANGSYYIQHNGEWYPLESGNITGYNVFDERNWAREYTIPSRYFNTVSTELNDAREQNVAPKEPEPNITEEIMEEVL